MTTGVKAGKSKADWRKQMKGPSHTTCNPLSLNIKHFTPFPPDIKYSPLWYGIKLGVFNIRGVKGVYPKPYTLITTTPIYPLRGRGLNISGERSIGV